MPLADYSPCSGDICDEVGADISRPVAVSLCCVSAEVTAGVVEFSKWSVEASGTRYEKDGGTVNSGGFSYGSVTSLSAVKTAMGPDDPCI
ncbi:hypothetical protein L0Y65_01320 [Candidatus Micrarchaeota archaeon]|nr:hypothetical protein [Candidatus Micrarchaeota archaeon]